MAERYPLGKNRIFYRTTNFREGVIVTVDILSPSLCWYNNISLVEEGKGLYFFDFDYDEEGSYGLIYYEDDKKVTTQSHYCFDEPTGMDVQYIKENVRFIEERTAINKGPNVIG